MSRYRGFRVRGWTINFTKFSLDEVADITGLSASSLRDTRREAYLPGWWEGSGVFTSRDVAEILTRYRLARAGLRLDLTDELGSFGAQAVLWNAIVHHDGVCEIQGTKGDVQRCLAELKQDTRAASDLTDLRVPKSHLVISRHAGGVVDLNRLAARLVTRSRKPLFTIEVSSDSPERRIKRPSKASKAAADLCPKDSCCALHRFLGTHSHLPAQGSCVSEKLIGNPRKWTDVVLVVPQDPFAVSQILSQVRK